MDAILRTEDWDVRDRLSDFGLDAQSLRDCARRGVVARSACTPNHPTLYPPLVQWAETACALRELTSLNGWTRLDNNNYPLAVDPTGQVAIAVATGDENTGVAARVPTTKAPKGPSTVAAVTTNSVQLQLFELPAAMATLARLELATTWIFLVHRALTEVRGELSLPTSIGEDGYINAWRERIILPSAPLDPLPIEVSPPSGPDIDVQIKRRA